MIHAEPYVSRSHEQELFGEVAAVAQRLLESRFEPDETGCRDGGEEGALVGEMRVGRRGAHADATGEIPEREIRMSFLQQLHPLGHQRIAQVAMVIALLEPDQASDGAILHSGGHPGILGETHRYRPPPGPRAPIHRKNMRPDLDVVKFMRSESTPQT